MEGDETVRGEVEEQEVDEEMEDEDSEEEDREVEEILAHAATATSPAASVARPETPMPPAEDVLSPLGEVQTRTRSARKKRKLEEPKGEGGEAEDVEDGKEESRSSKRSRRSTTAYAKIYRGEGSDVQIKKRDEERGNNDHEEDQEDEESDRKLPAVDLTTGVQAGRSSTSSNRSEGGGRARLSSASVVPRLGDKKLRIPAHQTPGKHRHVSSSAATTSVAGAARTTRSAASAFDPSSSSLVTGRKGSSAVPAPTRRGFDFGTRIKSAFATMGPSPKMATPSAVQLKPPPPSAADESAMAGSKTRSASRKRRVADSVAPEAEPNGRGAFVDRLTGEYVPIFVETVLPRTWFWLLVWGFVQAILLGSLGVYQSYLGSSSPTPPASMSTEPVHESLLEMLAELEQTQESLQREADRKRQEIEQNMVLYVKERSSLAAWVREHEGRVQTELDLATRVIREAQAYPLDEELSAEQVASLDIRHLQSLLPGAVVDVSFLAFWLLPSVDDMHCPDLPLGDLDQPRIAHRYSSDAIAAAIRKKVQQLQVVATVSANEIVSNTSLEEAYRVWIRNEILDYEDEEGFVPIGSDTYESLVERSHRLSILSGLESPSVATHKAGGPSMEAIQKLIDARLEMERADQTGHVDYASVLNGATVIYGGERGTSPSLVDQLPVVNRVASLWSLRNYGLRPETALTPTYPPLTSLGHCWSFNKDPNQKKQSGYATLTFRLAKPILVRSVSVEHPPQDITDRINSAIQSFRVVGYEFPNAQGMAWPLGSFEYRVGGDIRQEFEVKTEVKGESVPILESISLLIDSNWGANYSCLYRFRVFGQEK
jgi:hypothetical protein